MKKKISTLTGGRIPDNYSLILSVDKVNVGCQPDSEGPAPGETIREDPINGVGSGDSSPLFLGNSEYPSGTLNVPVDPLPKRVGGYIQSVVPGWKDPLMPAEQDFRAAAILDIPTPQSDGLLSVEGASPTPQSDGLLSPDKPGISRMSRRLYSRCILGLKLPGRYYFITWTSSPQSPPIKKSWSALRQWLKVKRPGAKWIYCFTDEGHGVIHMILRLGKGEKRLDVKEVRKHWERLHKANQIRIEHVPESMKDNLAAYLGEQRKKRSLAGEFMWQDLLVRWHWSKGWLPQGFTRAFGRVWVRLFDISPGQREKALSDWLHACHIDSNNILNGPFLKDGELIWPDRKGIQVRSPIEALVEFDNELKEEIKKMDLDDIQRIIDEDFPEDSVTLTIWKKKYTARNIQDECAQYNDIALKIYLNRKQPDTIMRSSLVSI
jgi:hypothetical protein